MIGCRRMNARTRADEGSDSDCHGCAMLDKRLPDKRKIPAGKYGQAPQCIAGKRAVEVRLFEAKIESPRLLRRKGSQLKREGEPGRRR